jgi:acetylglutamate kinase
MPDNTNPIVVKIGGSTLGHADTSFRDLVSLQEQGRPPVVVHGGGQTVTDWMQRQGLVPSFIRGLRVTDGPGLEVVVAVLAGLVNKQLVAAIHALGGRAVGLSGVDGGVLQATVGDPELGYVGDIVSVDTDAVTALLNAGYIPVLAPVAANVAHDGAGSSSMLNVNGDTAAGHLALALQAERLVFLTDVEGVLDSSGRLIARLTIKEASGLIASGTAAGGMIPKLEACITALESVPAARILDGRIPGALLNALGDDGAGTLACGTGYGPSDGKAVK